MNTRTFNTKEFFCFSVPVMAVDLCIHVGVFEALLKWFTFSDPADLVLTRPRTLYFLVVGFIIAMIFLPVRIYERGHKWKNEVVRVFFQCLITVGVLAASINILFHSFPGHFLLYEGMLTVALISIWHTDAILSLMHDIPNISLTIVGAERLAADSVADALENLTGSLILRDSEKSTLTRLAAGRELVVVTPQVSQAPVEVSDGVTVPTLEKILVDILCDNALHALTGSEAYAIYAAAFDRYAVSRKTLLRYGGRRNRTEAVNTILKEIEK